MKNNIKERIANVMSAVFEISQDQVEDDTSPESIKSWDSLKHMNLVIALEEEFGIEFNNEEILKIPNYKSLVSMLSGKISIK